MLQKYLDLSILNHLWNAVKCVMPVSSLLPEQKEKSTPSSSQITNHLSGKWNPVRLVMSHFSPVTFKHSDRGNYIQLFHRHVICPVLMIL